MAKSKSPFSIENLTKRPARPSFIFPPRKKNTFDNSLLQALQALKVQPQAAGLPTFKLDKPTKPLTTATAKPVKPTYLDTGDTSAIDSTGSSITDPTATAQLPTVVEDVGATATGFRTKKSSRRMAKSGAQGYGSMKISTNTPFSSAINLG